MEQILQQLSQDLQNLAMPRTYDWLILLVSAISIILSFIIFKRQTKISEKQTEIMEQQNEIALFDKKFEIYVETVEMGYLSECLNEEDWPAEDILAVLCLNYGLPLKAIDKKNQFEYYMLLNDAIRSSRDKLLASKFIFEFDYNYQILNAYAALYKIVMEIFNYPINKMNKPVANEFIIEFKECTAFYEEYSKKIEEHLHL